MGRVREGWGMHERGDDSKAVEVSKKIRLICGLLLGMVVLLKLSSILLSVLLTNPGLIDAYKKLGYTYHYEFNLQAHLPWLILGLYIIYKYSVGTYILFDHKHKLTTGFFNGSARNVRKIFIWLIIIQGITWYFTYNGYNKALSDFNDKYHLKPELELSIKFFIPVIIGTSLSLTAFALYTITIKGLHYKANIEFDSNRKNKINNSI